MVVRYYANTYKQ